MSWRESVGLHMNKSLATIFRTAFCCLGVWALSQAYSQTKQIQKTGNEPDRQAIQVLSGKIAVDGGDGVPDATVVLECNGTERARTATDREGNFTLTPNISTSPNSMALPERGPASSADMDSCVLYGDAPGYASEHVYVANEASLDQIAEVGTIVLHPLSVSDASEGTTISIVTLSAPPNAKKAFEKGQQQARKRKWQEACDYFRQALKIYPRYTVAWLALGRAQIQANTLSEAEQSFQQAATQKDDHSTAIAANTELMKMALTQKNWRLLAGTTDQIVELSPDLSPKVWFFNSVAKFNLGNVTGAEHSAQRGLALDAGHSVPQLEYLCGVILARESNYVQAIEHLRTYLELAPKADDVPAVRTLLPKLEDLASQPAKRVAP